MCGIERSILLYIGIADEIAVLLHIAICVPYSSVSTRIPIISPRVHYIMIFV